MQGQEQQQQQQGPLVQLDLRRGMLCLTFSW
jgi:hypothetical protein